ELGEVEAALARHPLVLRVAAAARQDRPEGKRLAAYVIMVPGYSPSTVLAELRDLAEATLPPHMVPAHIAVVQEFPLTPSGKISRKDLPAPGTGEGPPDRPGEPAPPPGGAIGEILCTLTAELAGLDASGGGAESIGIGVDSIVAVLLATRAREAGLDLSAQDVLEATSLRTLAHIAAGRGPLAKEKPQAAFCAPIIDSSEITELERQWQELTGQTD
ncbi:MAG: AMP-binding enzyme, partial [Streptosporangiaceae bacterium]